LGVVNYQIKTEYNNVLLCAQAKSGSLYLHYLLGDALGYERLEVGFDLTGGEVYYPRMLLAKYMDKNTISHCHESCGAHLIKIIGEIDLKPIVNTRNLLDTLVSRRDRLVDYVPPGTLPPSIKDKFPYLDNEHQLDILIEMLANNYINFFTSWEAYQGDVMRISYEEMLADEVGLVKRVADWLGCGIVRDVEKMSREIKDSGGINFNKGIVGRGRKLFNDRQKEEIARRADILGCKDEDFLAM
jgi:hypothetical protein